MMHPILKNSLAVISGLIIGGSVNMGLIMISGSVIPPPNGVDVTTMESLKANLHLFEPKHFVFPFLAHAIGTLVGAIITGLMATPLHKTMSLPLSIGFFFFNWRHFKHPYAALSTLVYTFRFDSGLHSYGLFRC